MKNEEPKLNTHLPWTIEQTASGEYVAHDCRGKEVARSYKEGRLRLAVELVNRLGDNAEAIRDLPEGWDVINLVAEKNAKIAELEDERDRMREVVERHKAIAEKRRKSAVRAKKAIKHLQQDRDELIAELDESARLLGVGGSKEARLLARVDELEAKLPKTGDGKDISLGDRVYFYSKHQAVWLDVEMFSIIPNADYREPIHVHGMTQFDEMDNWKVNAVYSTPEAAKEAGGE